MNKKVYTVEDLEKSENIAEFKDPSNCESATPNPFFNETDKTVVTDTKPKETPVPSQIQHKRKTSEKRH